MLDQKKKGFYKYIRNLICKSIRRLVSILNVMLIVLFKRFQSGTLRLRYCRLHTSLTTLIGVVSAVLIARVSRLSYNFSNRKRWHCGGRIRILSPSLLNCSYHRHSNASRVVRPTVYVSPCTFTPSIIGCN